MIFDFIEINRVITNKRNEQIIVPETLKIGEIKAFRPWHKSSNDTFKGDATLVVLYNKSKVTGQEDSHTDDDNNKAHTMLICEAYSNFLKRLSGRVIINGKATEDLSDKR